MDVSLYSFFRRIGDEGDAIRQYAENLVQEFSPDGSIKPLDFMPNPWRFYDAYDREVPLVSDDPNIGPGQGFIWPFSEPNARLLLKRIREDENVDIQRLFGVDLNASVFDATPTHQNWSAGLETGYHFGTRRQANALIGADALRVGGLTGDGVNVLVCDQGFDSNYLKALGGKYGGGFGALVGNKIEMPGKGGNPLIPVPAQHGSMMLRTLVDLAPDATYFDLPLLPRRIDDVRSFTLDAILTLNLVNFFLPEKHKPWVIVNAWGVVNRFAEQIRGEYTSNNHHWLNALYRSIGEKRDVVFAAGNNGQFGAEPRVPGYDRGPNESIYGANGAPEVTCVGAVRSDAT